MVRILLWGPLPIKNDVIGGTKVSFDNLVRYLAPIKSTKLQVINTSRALAGRSRMGALWANIVTFLRSILQLAFVAWCSDVVMINMSARAAVSTSWILLLIAKIIIRKPFVLRLFGGDMYNVWEKAPTLYQKLFLFTIRRADIVYFQTAVLVRQFAEYSNAQQLPTTRNMPARTRPLPKTCKRALCLSQVKKSKGIFEILEASNKLNHSFEFKIVGPMFDCEEYIDSPDYPSASISPPIPMDEVPALIESYDVMLLPSKRLAEGYPGVLIEAMQLGLPAIVTELETLSEIVIDRKNGYLVPLDNSAAIAAALNHLADNPRDFQNLQSGAMKMGEEFREKHVMDALLADLSALAIKGR